MRHTLSVLVENKPGVLTRISGLFARRGFNIDSLAVGETEDPKTSRMTISVDAQDKSLEQVTKQLHKLINVIKITDMQPDRTVERELVLVKVSAGPETRSEVMQIVEIFRAKIIDVSRGAVVIEVTGTREKVEAMLTLFRPFGLIEVARTGKIAMGRGHRAT